MRNKNKTWWILALLVILISNIPALEYEDKPYVILISFDGFRWDYPNRGITPNLKKMEDNGVSALSLQPVFPSKTFPNHYSIITGLYPVNHGIIHNDFYDVFSKERYKVGKKDAIQNAKWYQGEAFWETAERQGITTASYFWPGSELTLKYRRPTYVEYYDESRPYEKRIEGVIDWLKQPKQKHPHFITLYFEETDTYGHRNGPDSPEINKAIKRLDDMLGLLFTKLEEINYLQKTNIIVVSDHGMTSVDSKRTIYIDSYTSSFHCKIQGEGPLMMIDCPEEQLGAVFKNLKQNEHNFKVYLKNEVPDYFHFSNHQLISPILLIAEPGWLLKKAELKTSVFGTVTKGDHGYDNFHIDMHGIFFAMGPAFKKGYRTGTLRNIDIYPLLCKILGIFPRQNIDGKFERIGFILRK